MATALIPSFTPADWNENSPREVENKGAASSPIDQYRASKTLAERAFWKFIADEKPAWDGATVLPSLVFGPLLQQVARKEELNTSVGACVCRAERRGREAGRGQADKIRRLTT